MADKRISELDVLASIANGDLFAVVDDSATETKQFAYSALKSALNSDLTFPVTSVNGETGAVSLGIDDVLAVGQALTAARTIDLATNPLDFISTGGNTSISLTGINLSAGGGAEILQFNGGTDYEIKSSGSDGDSLITLGKVSDNTKSWIKINPVGSVITLNSPSGHVFNHDVSITGKLTVTGDIDPAHIYLDEQGSDPANVANKGIIYTKDVGGVTNLFYESSSAVVTQLSGVGGTYQPLDSDLTSWAAVTRAAGFDTFAATPSSANLISLVTDETGSGALVFANTPTFVTPVLGTPNSGSLSNCTGYPLAQLTGAGANVLAFLATPSSANLISAVTDETGSGALVFANTPTLVTPILGTPTSGALSNCTAYPLAQLTGAGANVLTFLATPTSANFAAAISDEITGGASVVLQTNTAVQTIASTIVWTGGTPPATPLAEQYIWSQTGKVVTVMIRMEYTTAGATNTDLTIDFPGDLPTPAAFTSWDNSEAGISISNGIVATTRTNDPVATRGSVKKSAGGVYQFKLTFASNASILAIINVTYIAA